MLNGVMPITDGELLSQMLALTRASLFDGVQVLGVSHTYILNLSLNLRVYLNLS